MLIVIARPGMMTQAEDEVRTVLRIERRVPNNQPDSFSISTSQQMVEDFHKVTAMVALVSLYDFVFTKAVLSVFG